MRMDLVIHAALFAFAMPKKKFYAVSEGRKCGVFTSWEECQKQVHGFRNAKFKGFATLQDARNFCGIFAVESKSNTSSQEEEKKPKIKTEKRAIVPPAAAAVPANKRPRLQAKQPEPEEEIPNYLSVLVSFDGGSRGNPGVSGAGAEVILVEKNAKGVQTARRKIQLRKYLGNKSTNNEAEWTGALTGLEQVLEDVDQIRKKSKAKKGPKIDLVVQGDSQLVIRQLQGIYQCKNPSLKKIQTKFNATLSKLRPMVASLQISYQHVYRNDNGVADRLANEAMDAKRSWISASEDRADDSSSDDDEPSSTGRGIKYIDV